MRSTFQEYYSLSNDDFKSIWSECLFVLDTNVLLRLFRYRQNTVDYVFEVLEHFKDRLWIPHQVGWEFQRNRDTKIDEGRGVYDGIIDKLTSVENYLTSTL